MPNYLIERCTGWSKQDWQKVDVLLKCGTGKDASSKQELQVILTAAMCLLPSGSTSRSSYCLIALPTRTPQCSQCHSVFQDIWPHLTNLKWIHSASAGVEKLLFPELIKSDVIVTNAKVVPSLRQGHPRCLCKAACSKQAFEPPFHFIFRCISWERVNLMFAASCSQCCLYASLCKLLSSAGLLHQHVSALPLNSNHAGPCH